MLHMKRLKYSMHTVIFIALLPISMLIFSCTGKVSGEVFHDLNGNGLWDLNEPPASEAEVTITLDGKVKARGLTMEDGSFSAPVKGKGEYCVNVNTSALENSMKQYGIPIGDNSVQQNPSATFRSYDGKFKATGVDQGAEQEEEVAGQEQTTDSDGDGIADTTDNCPDVANQDQKDTDGDGKGDACGSDSTGDKDNDGVKDISDNCPDDANADQKDTDGDGKGDLCDTDTPDDSGEGDGEEVAEVTFDENKGYCQKCEKFKPDMDVSIGIKTDFTKAINDISKPLDVKCYPGDTPCLIPVAYPAECTLEPLPPPESMCYAVMTQVQEGEETADEKPIQPKAASIAPSVTPSEMNVKNFYFEICEDIKSGTTTRVLQPKVKCRDNIYPLASRNLQLVNEADARVTMDFSKVDGDDHFIVKVTVKNKGESIIKDGMLDITLLGYIEVDQSKTLDSDCHNQISVVSCELGDLEPGAEINKTIHGIVQLHETETHSIEAKFYTDDRSLERIAPATVWSSSTQDIINEKKEMEEMMGSGE